MHRGLVHISVTLARHGIRRVIAPSARPPLLEALGVALAWMANELELKPVRHARSLCFALVPEIQRATLEAIRASMAQASASEHQLDAHAEGVVWRYVSLSARLAQDAVILTLDGVTKPEALAPIVQQVAAARAYQAAGLGAARQPELRERAREQAEFECLEQLSVGHAQDMLALQLFHEYLGVRWKVLHDAERAYIDSFVDWAMAGSAAAGSAMTGAQR
jgi:hypothetical protein